MKSTSLCQARSVFLGLALTLAAIVVVSAAVMEPYGKWEVHDRNRPQPPVVTPGATFSQGAPPPSDAEMLFNGTGLAKWQNERGGDATWITNADYVESVASGSTVGGGI